MPRGKQLAHRLQGQKGEAGCVRGTALVWSAMVDTPRSIQAVSCGSRQRLKGDRGPGLLFSPSRVRRASARESPCPAPVVGRQRVAAGRGVTLSLGARHRAERYSVTTQRPLSQEDCQTHAPHESVHVPLTCSTGTPHRLRTRMCDRTTHPLGFIRSLTRLLVRHTHTRNRVECDQCVTRVTPTHVCTAACLAFAVAREAVS